MTTITPPTPPQPPPSTTAAAPVVVVQSPPPALARLAVGQLLQATVAGQSARNLFQVQTPLGNFSIQSALVLPQGGALVLQLQSQSPVVQFQLNSLNGEAPPLAARAGKAAPQSFADGPRLAPGVRPQAATTVKLTPGSILQATVLRPLSQPAGMITPTPGAAPSAAAGGGALIQDKPTAPFLKPPSPAGQGTDKPALGPVRGGGAAAKGFLPSGSQLKVVITGLKLPNPAAASTTPTTPGPAGSNPALGVGKTLTGTVTGSTPSGHPIVQTRAGVFALTTQTVVPRGATVSMEVLSAPNPPPLSPGAQPALHETLFTSRRWPALEQFFQAVHEANPAAARQVVNAVVPRPDAGLTSGMIFFLSALRGGDLRAWIGDAPIRLIGRTRPNVVGRTSEDFTSLARMADAPETNDWRVALIPLNSGAAIEQIRLLLRQNENEDDEDGEPSDSRFVIDVELSRLGRLQLDGLVRDNGKSLDLIVRSEMPLDETMQNEIRDIFLQSAEFTGLKGGVNFQAAPANFVDIPDPSTDHDLGLVV